MGRCQTAVDKFKLTEIGKASGFGCIEECIAWFRNSQTFASG